jgi:hypothetical protein
MTIRLRVVTLYSQLTLSLLSVLMLMGLTAPELPAPTQSGARVTLSPRTVVDTLTIKLTGFRSYNLSLLNDKGRTVWSRANGTQPVHKVAMAAWPAGKYYLRVFGAAESFAESFEFEFAPTGGSQ